jgi:crotonobetainyl-CoA:carnitine CoA-transferase CaiB-like acyl-CoA transferase
VWAEKLWEPFCAVIERPELARDPRFVDRKTRFAHRDELRAIIGPIFRERTIADWMARLEKGDVLCVPVNDFKSLATDPQVQATGLLVDEQHPRAGRFTTLGTAVRFSATPGTRRSPAPALGEHTDTVLREAGLDADRIRDLRGRRVVA